MRISTPPSARPELWFFRASLLCSRRKSCYAILHYTILYYTILYYTRLDYTMLSPPAGVGYWGGVGCGLGQIHRHLGSTRPPPLGGRLILPFPSMPSACAGTPGRRGRGDASADDGDVFAKKSDLEPLLSDFKESLGEDVRPLAEQLTGAKVEDFFRNYDNGIQKRLSGHDAEIADLNKHIAAIETDHDKFKADLAKMQDALALTEATAAQTVRVFQEEDFDRQPDLTLVRPNASELVARPAVLDSIKPWLSDAGFQEDHWGMIGGSSGISRNCPVRSAGPDGLASRRARKCLQVRRQPDGTWRPNPMVVSPMGRRVEIYISPDKSPKQLRTEQGGRLKAFKAVHPNKNTHLDKRSGMVPVGWSPCAKTIPNPEPNSCVVQWNVAVLDRAGVSKQDVMNFFNLESGTDAGIQWQI